MILKCLYEHDFAIFSTDIVPLSAPQYSAPQTYVIAGSGGKTYSNGG